MMIETAQTRRLPENISPERDVYSLEEVSQILAPEGFFPTSEEVSKAIAFTNTLLADTNAEFQIMGEVPILLTNNQRDQTLPYLPAYPHLNDLYATKTDSRTNILVRDSLRGPKIQLTVENCKELDHVTDTLIRKLLQADPYSNQWYHKDPKPDFRAHRSRKGSVHSDRFNREEFGLDNLSFTTVDMNTYEAEFRLVEKNTRYTITWGEDRVKGPYLSIKIGFYSGSPIREGRKYNDDHQALEFEITPRKNPFRPVKSSWDLQAVGQWQPGQKDLLVISHESQTVLHEPLTIDAESLDKLRHPLIYGAVVSEIIEKAVMGENNLLLHSEGKEIVQRAFDSWQTDNSQETQTSYCAPAVEDSTLRKLRHIGERIGKDVDDGLHAFQRTLLSLAEEENARPIIDEIQARLIRSVIQNPGRFWRYFRATGFHWLFPSLNNPYFRKNSFRIDQALHARNEADVHAWVGETSFRQAHPVRNRLWSMEYLYDHAYALAANPQKLMRMKQKGTKYKKAFLQDFEHGGKRLQLAFSRLNDSSPINQDDNPFAALEELFQFFPRTYPETTASEAKPQWDPQIETVMKACIKLSQSMPEEEHPFAAVMYAPLTFSWREDRFHDLSLGHPIDPWHFPELAHVEKWQLYQQLVEAHDAQTEIKHQYVFSPNWSLRKRTPGTNHAEMLAIDQAWELNGRKPLTNWTLVSNVEPCPACYQKALECGVGHIIWAIPSNMGGSRYGLNTAKQENGQPTFAELARGRFSRPPRETQGVFMPEALAVFEVRAEYRHEFQSMFLGAHDWYEESVLKPSEERFRKSRVYDDYI